MTVKAICSMTGAGTLSETQVTVNVCFIGIPFAPGLGGNLSVDFDNTDTAATMEAGMKQAVKDYLISQGITFGNQDSVKFVGEKH